MARGKRPWKIDFTRQRKSKARHTVVTLLSLALAMMMVLGTLVAWFPIGFVGDLIANLAVQLIVVQMIGLCVLLGLRRWALAAVGLMAVGVLVALPMSFERARFDPSEMPYSDNHYGLRVVIINFFAFNDNPDEALMQVLDVDADVMAFIETPQTIVERLRWDDAFRARYPHFHLPDRALAGFPILLSKYPLLAPPDWSGRLSGMMHPGFLLAVVDHPRGQFVSIWSSPRSPRNPERWAEGNEVVRGISQRLRELFGPVGQRTIPVVQLSDLNGTPTGWRSRTLASEAGLYRAKPWSIPGGTYHAAWPRPLQVAIDDALVSNNIIVTSWRRLEAIGSDHTPVIVELTMPSGNELLPAAER